MSVFRSIRSSENFHIVLWLFKDLCWVLEFKVGGLVMIVPTISVAAWIAWRCRRSIGEFLHSLAVVLWIGANSVWMVGEFYHREARPIAKWFFIAGVLCVAWYYLVLLPRGKGGEDEGVTQP